LFCKSDDCGDITLLTSIVGQLSLAGGVHESKTEFFQRSFAGMIPPAVYQTDSI
jgi:hypothetical protein